jgi:hypothetical protein
MVTGMPASTAMNSINVKTSFIFLEIFRALSCHYVAVALIVPDILPTCPRGNCAATRQLYVPADTDTV